LNIKLKIINSGKYAFSNSLISIWI